MRQGIKPFDWEVYLLRNPDLCKQGILTEGDCKRHYERHGKREGRTDQIPDDFDVYSYMDEYSLMDPRAAYVHYKNVGVFRGYGSTASLVVHHANKPIIIVLMGVDASQSSLDFFSSLRYVDHYNVVGISCTKVHPLCLCWEKQDMVARMAEMMARNPTLPHKLLFVGEESVHTHLAHLSHLDIPRLLYLPPFISVSNITDFQPFHKVAVGEESLRSSPDQILLYPLPSDMVLFPKEIDVKEGCFLICFSGENALHFHDHVFVHFRQHHHHNSMLHVLEKKKIGMMADYPWLSQCHALVSYHMSQNVMRAMCCGKPVLVHNNQHTQEFLRHMETGLVFDNDNHLLSILRMLAQDPALCTRIGDNATMECNTRFHKNHFLHALDQLFF